MQHRKAWPDHLKSTLRDYMVDNQFFNYKSTHHGSCVKLDTCVQHLQTFFDQTSWDASIHPVKLKEKVCHQIHKIRAEVEKEAKDPVHELRNILHKISIERHPEAMRVVLDTLGKDIVRAGLDEHEWLNFDEAGAGLAITFDHQEF